MKAVRYRFDDYLLDAAARELWRGGERVAIPPKSLECLAYLLQHRDRAVGRDELIAAVWGRVDASDTLLTQTIWRARRAIGDEGDRSLRTVPRFGYRWVAAVRVEEGPVDHEAPSVAVAQATAPPAGEATGDKAPSVDDYFERLDRAFASLNVPLEPSAFAARTASADRPATRPAESGAAQVPRSDGPPKAAEETPRPARTGGDDVIKTVRREEPKVGRNDPCPCGSGRKYKKCHGAAA